MTKASQLVTVDAVLDAALEAVNDNDLSAAAVILRNAKALLAGHKVLTEEQCSEVADRAFDFFEVPAREREEGLARYVIQLTIEALAGAAPAIPLGETEEFREAVMCFRKAAWERDHGEMIRWQRRILELARSWRGAGAAPPASGEPLAWLIEVPGAEGAPASRSVHLHNAIGDYRAINPAATVTPLAPICGATEQSLGLHVAQADAIRELLDKHAPNTTGNLQTRLAQVLQTDPDGNGSGSPKVSVDHCANTLGGSRVLDVLRAAMADAGIEAGVARADLIGHFCNHWNAAVAAEPQQVHPADELGAFARWYIGENGYAPDHRYAEVVQQFKVWCAARSTTMNKERG